MDQGPFGDIPLFRELQRLLSSSQGPFNQEIARQVASSVAAGGGSDHVDPTYSNAYPEAVITAQQQLSGFTRLQVDELIQGEAIDRSRWIEETLTGWIWLIEAFSERFTDATRLPLEGPLGEDEGEGPGGGIAAALKQIVPFMMGLQAGSLIGELSKEALHRNELPIPRDDKGRSFIVAPNAQSVVDSYNFDRGDFISWVALRDTGRHLVLSAHPWVDRYLRSALIELIDSIEVDLAEIERRMTELGTAGPEALTSLGMGDSLPVMDSQRHTAALGRLQALFAVIEGYASHAAAAVAGQSIPSHVRIEEGMTRHFVTPSEGKKALSTVLGISFDRTVSTAGATFSAAVTKMRGIEALNEVWAAPDNLPTPEEIKDPFAWIERVLDVG